MEVSNVLVEEPFYFDFKNDTVIILFKIETLPEIYIELKIKIGFI